VKKKKKKKKRKKNTDRDENGKEKDIWSEQEGKERTLKCSRKREKEHR